MLRSLWQSIKSLIWDEPTEQFKSQEDIDIGIEDKILETGAAILYNDVPQGAQQRKRTFLSPDDALDYASTIPSEYVTFAIWDGDTDTGDRTYEVWVTDND